MLYTTKDLAVEMQLHVKTVQRWWKKLDVPPDACGAKGCHRWTEAGFRKLLKRWNQSWRMRGHAPELQAAKFTGKLNLEKNQLPLFKVSSEKNRIGK